MIRLNFAMTTLWSDIPGLDVTSTTVSGLLVRIKYSVFPDAGHVISIVGVQVSERQSISTRRWVMHTALLGPCTAPRSPI